MYRSEVVIDSLDPHQNEAVETLRGPVVILAGAGAGKTRTITHRIAHGVQTGVYAPDRVLAVTFTRKAAAELQMRLQTLGVHGVQARTFHGAALAQLTYFWAETVGGTPPAVLPGKVPLLGQATQSLGITVDRETLRDLASEVEWRKVSLLSIDEYGERIAERGSIGRLSGEQLVDIQRAYERLKESRKQIDFEDVIVLTTGMLAEEPRVAAQVRERYRFFTVDEYQDISPAQYELLRAWLGERNDVCVVGDASQTIYSFAGASSDFLLRFNSDFRGAHEFRLERNYRSAPAIVAAANRLMEGKPGALRLTSTRSGTSAVPRFEWFSTEATEARGVAELVAKKIASGTKPSDVGILYRSHSYSMRLEHELREEGIPVAVQGSERYFERAEVKRAVMEIRAQSVIPDERPLFQVVSDVIRGLGWTAQPPSGQANKEKWEALGALLSLTDEMPGKASVRDFSEELLRRSRAGHEPTFEAVSLSTIHSAKGLEWPIVFLAGAAESVLPISYATTEEGIEEERRLFYVALTRARNEIWISGAAGGGPRARIPSRFLSEAGIRSVQ